MPAASEDGPSDPAVSESTGSANYRIPIAVPPGPGGLAPTLALSYSSRGGDGPYGVGWALSLGEIVCSSRFGVPNYATCQQYEMDGQLLTQDGTTAFYHSFVETFQRIEFLGNTQGWQVTNPSGTILRYGTTSDARILAGADIAKWLLSEIQDPFGNTIFITYDTSDVGTRYPSLVTYGAGATKATGKRSVEFVFGEVRPDPIRDFSGGIERVVTKRLTDIKVNSYGNLVRRYAFGYDLTGVSYSTGRSRLAWVQQFGNDCTGDIASCTGLPRQEFEYTDPNDDGLVAQYSKFTKDQEYVVPFAGNRHVGAVPVRIADLNGDGLPDLIYGGISFGSNFNTNDETRVEINTGSGFEDPTDTEPDPGVRCVDDGTPEFLGRTATVRFFADPAGPRSGQSRGAAVLDSDGRDLRRDLF
jgi:hypothetical protein